MRTERKRGKQQETAPQRSCHRISIYSVREKAKTVNEIADDLAVSPVYVEDETEYLCRFAFLDEAAGKYISRVIVCEENAERSAELDAIYSEAASFFAPALFDSLYAIAEDESVYGGKFGNVSDDRRHAA